MTTLTNIRTTGLTALAVAMSWALTGPVSASAAELIRDEAGIFKSETVKQVTERLNSLQRSHKVEVTIETFAQPPEQWRARIQQAGNSQSTKERVYTQWLEERARTLQARGVFVLISQSPGHVQVGFDRGLQVRGATNAQRLQLRDAMLAEFRNRDFDAGLVALASQAENFASKLGNPAVAGAHQQPVQRDAQHVPAQRQAAREGGGTSTVIMWVVAIVVLMVVFSIISGVIRSLFGGTGGGYGQPGYGGGGGGFLGNVMGGLFGAMAGHWIYNSFFGHHGQSFGGQDHTSNLGSDNTLGGGDFGGGDFGGGSGDWGGSDFGGGDFGGGGDF